MKPARLQTLLNRYADLLKDELGAIRDTEVGTPRKTSHGMSPPDLADSLVAYRSMPLATTEEAPAMLLVGWRLRTRLGLVRSSIEDNVARWQFRKARHRGSHSEAVFSEDTAAVNTDAQDCGEQLAKKAKDTRKTWSQEQPIAGWVMCNGCEMWIQLEHTPFATTDEAGDAKTYLCKHYERFRLLKEAFLLMTREMDKGLRLAMQYIATRLTEHIDNTAKERRAVREELAEERNWRTALCAQVNELRNAPLYTRLEAADQNLAQDSAAAEENERRVSGCARTGDNTECKPKSSLDLGKIDKVLKSDQNVEKEGPQTGQAWKVALSKKGKKKQKSRQMQELTTSEGPRAATPYMQKHLKDSTGVKRKERHAFIYRDESAARVKHSPPHGKIEQAGSLLGE
ncbi:hypothetical protein MRX96_027836 [Rhipicephalus microplus]